MSSPGAPKKTGSGYPGSMGLWGSTSDFNKTTFLVQQLLALVRTASLVQVVKCTTNDQVGPVGFVDVLPLVNMTDGLGNSSKHGTVYGLTYCRVQGGRNAIICDPCVGDIGVAVFADRDISVVKKTKKQANPGSRRKNNLADGMYLFGVLNAAPTQYVRFVQDSDGNPTGMEVVDKNGNKVEMTTDGLKMTDKFGQIINMKSDSIAMTTPLLSVTGAIKAGLGGADEVGLQTHRHPTAALGAPSAPTPGT